MRMADFELDPILSKDTLYLGQRNAITLLLMNNAWFPWYILVPHTKEIEWYQVTRSLGNEINHQIRLISKLLYNEHKIDKINIASIGNIVSQLHIHVVGRRHSDPCWPGVVWGSPHVKSYQKPEIDHIKNIVSAHFTFESP